jgi:hypothetical protein
MVSEGGLQAWSAAAFAVGIERGVAGMKEVRFIVDWRTSRASVTTVCVAHSTTTHCERESERAGSAVSFRGGWDFTKRVKRVACCVVCKELLT